MAKKVVIRPDLRTQGGEVSDILLNGRYVGSLWLVFREFDRVSGAIQLDKPSLSMKDKGVVVSFVKDYVLACMGAIQATECVVPVTYSSLDQIIEEEDEIVWVKDEVDELNNRESKSEPFAYELFLVGESRNQAEYHFYDEDQEWIAEAFMRTRNRNVYGEVNWMFEPTDDEIELVTEQLVEQYDENVYDSFVIHHKFGNELIETIDLTHEDLLEESNDFSATNELVEGDDIFIPENEDYNVVLVRDDMDTLTYEIYQQSSGGLPIGTATIDISNRMLTGFIDFRELGHTDDSDVIAARLMQELDKEKDYEGLSLTMLYQNEPIDELVIDANPFH